MRKDFEIHVRTGDVALKDTRPKSTYPFQWVDNPSGLSRYIYGEITVPSYISDQTVREQGVDCIIPYTPIHKECLVRIKREVWGGSGSYLQNPTDGGEWFSLYQGEGNHHVYASQLIVLSEDAFFIRLDGGVARIYDSKHLDLHVVRADRQNANLLIQCIPTNNYRYPLTGVGLVRWANSNIQYTDLASVLQREFANDGVKVNNADYDFDQKGLTLDLDTLNDE